MPEEALDSFIRCITPFAHPVLLVLAFIANCTILSPHWLICTSLAYNFLGYGAGAKARIGILHFTLHMRTRCAREKVLAQAAMLSVSHLGFRREGTMHEARAALQIIDARFRP